MSTPSGASWSAEELEQELRRAGLRESSIRTSWGAPRSFCVGSKASISPVGRSAAPDTPPRDIGRSRDGDCLNLA